MSVLKFIFKDTKKNTELVLPVTPKSYQMNHGINIETININNIGDISLAGLRAISTFKIDCLFPAKAYPFNQPNIDLKPFNYVVKFESWCDNHTILRFVISNTIVNVPVIIESITYGEQDGTGDIYATLSLRVYTIMSNIQTTNTGNNTRNSTKYTSDKTVQSYKVKSGDTLSTICRKYYGDTNLALKLAKYNNIKNVNLISVNSTIKIPNNNLL